MVTGAGPLRLEAAGVAFRVHRIEWRLPTGVLPEGGHVELIETLRARYPGGRVSLIVEHNYGDAPCNPLPRGGRGDVVIIEVHAGDQGLRGCYPPGALAALHERARLDVWRFVTGFVGKV